MMSRGPRPRRALADAIPLARLRGTVQTAGTAPEIPYDFTIISTVLVVFVRVKFAARILVPITEISTVFREEILLLRSTTPGTSVSRELWIRSKHGTWRFFRILPERIVEIGRDGQPLGQPAPG